MSTARVGLLMLSLLFSVAPAGTARAEEEEGAGMTLSWADNILKIHGDKLPGGVIEILYLEAYCRPGSTDREWDKTVIGHTTKLVSRSADGKRLTLRCELKDGVVVDHVITARKDEVDFQLTAHNPTDKASDAHWAQPCMRVGDFTGCGKAADPCAYVKKCFIFLAGSLERLPTKDWAMEARYTPGQTWCPPHVPRTDVNPRPLSKLVPSNGLIGCFSADEKLVLATAWEPYQELFQGVIRCIHSDFRIGGLAPGEKKSIRGTIYVVPADIPALLKRYQKDFPEHQRPAK